MLSVTTGILESVQLAYDIDAETYLTYAEITDPVVKGHYNTFVVSAKANGYYSKLKVFRPYLTSNAIQNSFNAINVATHQLSYSESGITHSAATGMTGDGVEGYAWYLIDGSTFSEFGDGLGVCAGIWIKSSPTTPVNGYFMDNDASLFIIDASTPESYLAIGSVLYNPGSVLSTGFHLLNTHPTDDTTIQINGSVVASGAYTYSGEFESISFLNYFGGAYLSNASITCDFLGYGLTDGERASFYTDLLTLHTNLGR